MDQNHLIEALNILEKRLEAIESHLKLLPIPFELMYRPPGRDHVNIVEYLNEVDNRLTNLENGDTTN